MFMACVAPIMTDRNEVTTEMAGKYGSRTDTSSEFWNTIYVKGKQSLDSTEFHVVVLFIFDLVLNEWAGKNPGYH